MSQQTKVCEAWLANPLVNPRTGRAIKVNGPTYKALQKECHSLRLSPTKKAKTPKVKTPKVKTPKPKTPKQTPIYVKYSYEKLVEEYTKHASEINSSYHLSRQDIAKFKPLSLPYKLYTQTIDHKDIALFANLVHLDLQLRGEITNKSEFIDILSNSYKHVFDTSKSTPYDLITIIGLGCDEKGATSFERYLKSIIDENDLNINSNVVECNVSLMQTLKVIAKTYCFMKPSLNDEFVKRIIAKIEPLLNESKHILLLGHSYGGSIAATVAKGFNNHKNAHLLQVATFGSIYVATTKEVSNVKLKQYMAQGDVALKCAKLTPPKTMPSSHHYDEKSNVIWITPAPDLIDKWDIHNIAYLDIMKKILFTQNVDVFM